MVVKHNELESALSQCAKSSYRCGCLREPSRKIMFSGGIQPPSTTPSVRVLYSRSREDTKPPSKSAENTFGSYISNPVFLVFTMFASSMSSLQRKDA